MNCSQIVKNVIGYFWLCILLGTRLDSFISVALAMCKSFSFFALQSLHFTDSAPSYSAKRRLVLLF